MRLVSHPQWSWSNKCLRCRCSGINKLQPLEQNKCAPAPWGGAEVKTAFAPSHGTAAEHIGKEPQSLGMYAWAFEHVFIVLVPDRLASCNCLFPVQIYIIHTTILCW